MSNETINKSEPAKPASASGVPQFFVDLARNAPAMMWVFTVTTFLSALLLFAIQPLFAKMVLPVLGGSPHNRDMPIGRQMKAATHTPRWMRPVRCCGARLIKRCA